METIRSQPPFIKGNKGPPGQEREVSMSRMSQ